MRPISPAGRPDEARSYAQLWERGCRLAAALIARGLERGDRFALMMRNHPEFVETLIAASITGCVFVPIDPRTKGDKLAYMLRNAGCRGVVGVLSGPRPVTAWGKYWHTHVIESVKDLPELIETEFA